VHFKTSQRRPQKLQWPNLQPKKAMVTTRNQRPTTKIGLEEEESEDEDEEQNQCSNDEEDSDNDKQSNKEISSSDNQSEGSSKHGDDFDNFGWGKLSLKTERQNSPRKPFNEVYPKEGRIFLLFELDRNVCDEISNQFVCRRPEWRQSISLEVSALLLLLNFCSWTLTV
jgi:hypothetical protein